MKNKNLLPDILSSASRFFLVTCLLAFMSGLATAQDLVVQDTTVSGDATFAALNSVTAGPNFIVSTSGNASLIAPRVSIIPVFSVAAGGQLFILSGAPNSVDEPEPLPVPDKFLVHQNYPNPFNPSTRIAYELPTAEHVNAAVYDLNGRLVKQLVNEKQNSGNHTVVWDGTGQSGEKLSSGIYILNLRAGKHHSSLKMTLLK